MPSKNPPADDPIAVRRFLTGCLAGALATCLGMVSSATTSAFAGADDGFVGPDWVEDDDDDAGNTLQTAAKVKGNGSNVNTINGATGGGGGFVGGGGLGDFQDIFLIFIRDPQSFSATTVGPVGDAEFDTRLWLFRPDGRGLLAADNASEDVVQTSLKGVADQGGFAIPGPGVYGLAIGGAPTRPFAGKNIPMFPPPPAGVTVAANEEGLQKPLAGWNPPNGATGTFRIAVTGVGFIPFSCGEGGDCFQIGTTPGCRDLSCCSRVCEIDSFCCDVLWDYQCTSIATEICGSCGNPSAGSCFEPHPQPRCDDRACCKAVCSIDPGCCDVEWDAGCVSLANKSCTTPCSTECPGDLNLDAARDGADLGLMLGAWGEEGCSDIDGNGITDGGDLGLLLGGWGLCPACGDPDSGGCLTPHPERGCADPTCCELVCVIDPACCSIGWDEGCAVIARKTCTTGCGDPKSGPCDSSHMTPGCSNGACCNAVCELLPRCCTDGWDEACVEFAIHLPECSG